MKTVRSGFLTAVLTAAAAVAAVLVLAFLCAGAVKTEKKASLLTKAVIAAQSASESFYSAENGKELAKLLSCEFEYGIVTAVTKDRTVLKILLSEKDGMEFAKISVSMDEEIIYELECRKAMLSEDGSK